MRLTTLCYICEGDGVLMLYRNKKKDDINAGKWIGVGGKFLENESPDECVRREVFEETGISPDIFRYCGVVTFIYNDAPAEYMHVYSAEVDTRQLPKGCDEGDLSWVAKDDIDKLSLWPGDRIFLPLVLNGEQGFSLKLKYHDDVLIQAVLNGCYIDEYK